MISIGYEFEFVADLAPIHLRKGLNHYFDTVKTPTPIKKSRRVVWDASIKNDDGLSGHELISPVYDINDGEEALKVYMDYIGFVGGQTNVTTGLHVNIGFEDRTKMEAVNFPKLLTLSNEKVWSRRFGRLNNEYCTSVTDKIKKMMKFENRPPKTFSQLEDQIHCKMMISKAKYDSINLRKVSTKTGGYVEFRVLGNRNYHKKLTQVTAAIRDFTSALEDSITSNRDEEYRYSLTKCFAI